MAKQTGWVYIRKNKTKPNQVGFWSDKKKAEAVATYLATGNLALTAKIINVPEDTLRRWKASEWWREVTTETQEQKNLELSTKLEKIVGKTITAIEDRVENGEFMFDPRSGQLRRVPAKLRDLHEVSVDLIDKQRVLTKQVQNVESAESTEGRLLKLAEAFATFALGKKPEEKIINQYIEGEYSPFTEVDDAVHDQRETGLSEGEIVGSPTQEGSATEGPGSEECSPSESG